MVELAEELSAAAWKIRNLEDYDGRLERAAQRFDEISRERHEPALMVYETALKKSGRSEDEIRGMVRGFHETFEDEVLRRWVDGYDTRLFVRRRIHETEPVVGVVGGLDLTLFQYLRVAAGGNTLVPTENVSKALGALGYEGDEYETLAHAEGLALYFDLPAPIVGEMLEDLGREGFTDFPEPPSEPEENDGEGVTSEGDSVEGEEKD